MNIIKQCSPDKNYILSQCFTLSQMTNFKCFQTERVCRRQFNFDENGRKFSKRVENTVEKGKIACHEQFLLFPVFSKDLYYRHKKTRTCLGKSQDACTVQPVFKDHPREVIKVVSYIRWSLNACSVR